jgi:hypothetical protein
MIPGALLIPIGLFWYGWATLMFFFWQYCWCLKQYSLLGHLLGLYPLAGNDALLLRFF